MPSQLDAELNSVMDRLTAAGGLLETVPGTRHGRTVPMIAQAPPTLPALFARFCAEHAGKEFLIDEARRLTFAQAHALARRLAGALVSAHGVAKGDRVGIAARNSANYVLAHMAVLMAGACATLLNGWWVGEELAEGIDLAGCKLVLADAPRAERLTGHSHSAEIALFGHDEAGFDALLAGGDEAAALPALAGGDLATMLFTSGSTGKCKGACSDHLGVVQAALNYAAQTLTLFTVKTGRGDPPVGQPCALVNVPLFHVTGEVPLYLQSFVIGRKLVLMPKWDPLEAMRLIEREKVSYFIGVPLMSIAIAEHPRRHEFDLTSCITFAAGGAPRPVDHVARIHDAMPHAFPILGYGLTETNAVGCGNFNENYLAKPGSTGPASRPLVEIATFADDGARLAEGATGEIGIRSVCNFLGYWNDPEATAAAFTPGGFVRTGDLGYVDADGYLFIVDRKKDLIIRGGENIASAEVEAALYAHPGVAEASVFGLPCPVYGEVPVAVWLARPEAEIGEADLRGFLEERLAAFKVPVRLWQETSALPRLGTEKVDKRALKARYAAGWDPAAEMAAAGARG
ncbi:MAG: class I adenylate-forming enzyme family protein [Novosphingobium sp.]